MAVENSSSTVQSKKRKRSNKNEHNKEQTKNGSSFSSNFNELKTSLKNKSNKLKKKLRKPKATVADPIPITKPFDNLPEEFWDSDYEEHFGVQPEPNTVLIDSDDESQNLRNTNGSTSVASADDPKPKKQRIENELAKNQDFISFDFSSDDSDGNPDGDEEESEKAYTNDGYLSNDDTSLNTMSKKTVQDLYPWVKDHDHSTQREIADWLTLEIKDFVAYISPSKDEILSRNTAVRKLKDCITSLWKDCEVHVFGSYATDLYLPGSDIDMVVVSNHQSYDTRSNLYQLSSHLRNSKLAIRMEVIAKAKVPIIKFVEPESNIHIDISFERTNGIDAARQIRKWLSSTPGLRELVLIIKQFLASRRLNNVHVGGLGGYSTICLVYSFLSLHPRLVTKSIDPIENLGALLIEFFELYGRNYGYDYLAIVVDDNGCKYIRKDEYPELMGRSIFSLAIQDPSDPLNNISRGSFNLRDIKKAFAGAFDLLSNRCYDLNNASYKERLGSSILGDVIKYRGKERDFKDERDLVVNESLKVHLPSEEDNDSNNDKYYFSDITVESEEEEEEVKILYSKKVDPIGEGSDGYDPEKPFILQQSKVADYMGLTDNESDSSLVEIGEKNASGHTKVDPNVELRKNSIDKVSRREYWLQKGAAL